MRKQITKQQVHTLAKHIALYNLSRAWLEEDNYQNDDSEYEQAIISEFMPSYELGE